MWTSKQDMGPTGVGSIIAWSTDMLNALQVTGEALKLAQKIEMLPTSMRNMKTQVNPLSSRCYQGETRLPTFVAQYGSRHRLPQNSLKQKGYLAHFVRPGMRVTGIHWK